MLTLKTTATVTKINRKSSSPCFKNLKVGGECAIHSLPGMFDRLDNIDNTLRQIANK